MNLQPVAPEEPAFRVKCAVCGKEGWSSEGDWFADLDGEPFVDYYCERCANEARD